MAESELPITLIVQITLTIMTKKVILKYPLANPELEINLHGPNFRNLVIPKPAESIEDRNVNLNKIAPSPIIVLGSCLIMEAIGDKTMIWGNASRNGSEIHHTLKWIRSFTISLTN